jgi:colanic acid biosynthesis protein WcaH
MDLKQETFVQIIGTTPLVSIDLVIYNKRREILLGYRRNRPAQNYWFVPGGRIRKNEHIQDALVRIARIELGITPGAGHLLGAFDHLYDDNCFGLPNLSTHYVVLAYAIEMQDGSEFIHDSQHAELKWWPVEKLLADPTVHDNTKLYFQKAPDNGIRASDVFI